MDAARLKRWAPWAAAVVALVAGLLIGLALRADRGPAPEPDPRAIANRVLISVREQGRIVTYSARFAAIVSARESRLGMTAEKTLILPGTARYSVDLSRLRRQSLAWDAPTSTLTVTLPPLEIDGPQIDFGDVREYSDGGLLLALTDSGRTLDQANRRSAQDELMRQARARTATHLAQDAAMRIVARAFALPLRSAGIDASVAVRFVDPAGREDASFLDRPVRIEDAVRNNAS
jgi:hypothetical protein